MHPASLYPERVSSGLLCGRCAVGLIFAALALSACVTAAPVQEAPVSASLAGDAPLASAQRPLIIAHRGASGYVPEHTLEAYDLGISQGADFIEPDLVSTQDGHLVARHENRIDLTTDVAQRFPLRKTTKTVEGKVETGWFIEDFTLAEIRTLRAKERLPFRSRAFDGKFAIPTFGEVVALAKRRSAELGRTVGVYPETKQPTYFRSLALPLEEPLLNELATAGWTTEQSPVFIQSFDAASLRFLKSRTRVRLIQLLGDSQADVSLSDVKQYAFGVGVTKTLLLRVTQKGQKLEPTGFLERARAAGLAVHVWTFRNESLFLAPLDQGKPEQEICRFVALGVEGLFTDFPDTTLQALETRCGRK